MNSDQIQLNELSWIEQFQNMDVRILGTKEDPLFNAKDIMEGLLGYADFSAQKWWPDIRNDNEMVKKLTQQIAGQGRQCMFLTEQGLIEVLSKSNQPLAKQFRIWIGKLLKSLRQGQIQLLQIQNNQKDALLSQKDLQLEQQQKAIEYYNSLKKIGYIYKIFDTTNPFWFYVGMTELPTILDRFKSHKNEASTHAKYPLHKWASKLGFQQLDIVQLEKVEYIDFKELEDREKYWIQLLNPSMNNGYEFKCQCKKILKQHHAIEQHQEQCQKYQHYLACCQNGNSRLM